VKTTLRSHPGIRAAEANLQQRNAELKAASGPFDPLFRARAGHTHDEAPVLTGQRLAPEQRALLTDTTSLDVGASWTTTWGTAILPAVGLARVHQRPSDSVTLPGVPFDPVQQAVVGLTLIQPLLRGSGTIGAASGIEAAKLGRDSSTQVIGFTAQQRAFIGVASYFQLVAATQTVTLMRDNAKAAEQLLSETRVLVEADQRPRTDLAQLEGNLAIRVRAVREAENIEVQALYALGDAMGLSAQTTPAWRPVDSLPAARSAPPDGARLVRQARQTRKDVRAARDTVASVAALLTGADYNTKPALDLSLSVGYRGALDDDGVDAFFRSPASNVPGVNAGVALSLELPFNNTAREAERDVRQAQLLQVKIAASDLDRRIPIDVLSALDDVRMTAAQLQASVTAVQKFRQALAAEHDRVKEGVGTIIDLVLTQEQLIRAEVSQVADHLRYAIALARLKFEIGEMPAEQDQVEGALSRMFDLRAPAPGGQRAGQ
jgi:outer membrane protein TolC